MYYRADDNQKARQLAPALITTYKPCSGVSNLSLVSEQKAASCQHTSVPIGTKNNEKKEPHSCKHCKQGSVLQACKFQDRCHQTSCLYKRRAGGQTAHMSPSEWKTARQSEGVSRVQLKEKDLSPHKITSSIIMLISVFCLPDECLLVLPLWPGCG